MTSLLQLLLLPSLVIAQKAPAWVPTFADEFNANELDLSRWSPHDPQGTAHAPTAVEVNAIEVKGGLLHIFSPATVTTFGTFAQTYGRFEIRCRVPIGPGLRPRFRLLPVPLGALPEIDVFETTGGAPSRVSFANRWGTEQTERSFFDSFPAPDLSAGFHTLAIEWNRDRIAWFIDGKQMFQSVDGIPHQPMFLVLDIAGASKSPSAAPTAAASFDIDYIRVYQRP